MRIIQLVQRPQARGAEIFASQLSNQLEGLGHEVLLISLFEGDFNLPFKGKQIHMKFQQKKRLLDYSAWKKLGQIIGSFKPEIVQANGADTLKYSVFARILVPGDYHLIFNNGGVVSYYIDSTIKRKFNQFLFSKVDALISVSNYSKNDLDSFLIKPLPHQVIPIGIDPISLKKKEETRRCQVLVHIAGFTPEKNHKEVLHIFEKLLLQKPDFQLWLIGDGPLKKKVEEEVQKKSFSEKVKFLGTVSNPFSHIPSNSFLILPSKIEGLPAVILEAFFNRIPVFAYAVGGIPDVIIHKVTGMLIPSNDYAAFSSSILEYLSISEIEREKILDNAEDLQLEKFQIPLVSLQFESFYNSL